MRLTQREKIVFNEMVNTIEDMSPEERKVVSKILWEKHKKRKRFNAD